MTEFWALTSLRVPGSSGNNDRIGEGPGRAALDTLIELGSLAAPGSAYRIGVAKDLEALEARRPSLPPSPRPQGLDFQSCRTQKPPECSLRPWGPWLGREKEAAGQSCGPRSGPLWPPRPAKLTWLPPRFAESAEWPCRPRSLPPELGSSALRPRGRPAPATAVPAAAAPATITENWPESPRASEEAEPAVKEQVPRGTVGRWTGSWEDRKQPPPVRRSRRTTSLLFSLLSP